MELLNGLAKLTFWEKMADFHGLLSMFSLVLFGAGIILYFVVSDAGEFVGWLKTVLFLLFTDLLLLDIFGLTIYMPYRTPEGLSPRTFLKSAESTKWLHTIVFEHKEFLAFAPPLIIFVAFMVTKSLGKDFNSKNNVYLKRSVIFSLVLGLIFVLIVAGEAVLVTKAAPLN